VPPVPPPPVVLQPLSPPPPAHPTELPPPAPVVANAVGVATPITGGLRITFGPGSADLNAATSEALRQLARAMPTGVFTLNAYTPGQPDDPSTPRRLSLDRALATRSLLMAEGIPSTRIIARGHQFGPNEPDGPADRVDITVTLPPPIKP
jgi:outer membrane protein OmpA-like peptidoglycan-associated protein